MWEGDPDVGGILLTPSDPRRSQEIPLQTGPAVQCTVLHKAPALPDSAKKTKEKLCARGIRQQREGAQLRGWKRFEVSRRSR
ncbi:hypothetical protein FKM82_007228 [Ascaphus truei]